VIVFVSSLVRKRYVKFISTHSKIIDSDNDMTLQAIDDFCVLADKDCDLPPLSHGKQWADYRLSPPEWKIIGLAQDCLRVSVLLSHDAFY
jgi:hypothetical protein